jgi:hypothetical protein
MVIGYQTPAEIRQQGKSDDRSLSHTTVWRMLGWLGIQVVPLQKGLELLVHHDPSTTCHRFVGMVAPYKYRSEARRQTLTTARRLLDLIDRWNRSFPEPFFPRFATRSGFG